MGKHDLIHGQHGESGIFCILELIAHKVARDESVAESAPKDDGAERAERQTRRQVKVYIKLEGDLEANQRGTSRWRAGGATPGRQP